MVTLEEQFDLGSLSEKALSMLRKSLSKTLLSPALEHEARRRQGQATGGVAVVIFSLEEMRRVTLEYRRQRDEARAQLPILETADPEAAGLARELLGLMSFVLDQAERVVAAAENQPASIRLM